LGKKFGDDFWKLIRGEEVEQPESVRATIGHSRVLAPGIRTPQHAWSNLVALLTKAAMRLREEGFYTQSLQLSLRLLRRHSEAEDWEKRARFFETQDSALLLAELAALWAHAPQDNILRIGVTLSSLVPANKHQLSLLEDVKQTRLMATLDKLNKRHRKNLVVFGTSDDLDEVSHAPIAFSHIPESYE